jgi:hypothetical protein
MITQTYYISTGRKAAMYTLRFCRDNTLVPMHPMAQTDFYICNLAATPELAEEKAQAYFDAVSQRIAQTDGFKLVFVGYADFHINQRRGKLSARDTRAVLQIEAGVFPFGKHAQQALVDAPASYVLYWADMGAKPENADNPVIQALSAACMGVALEKGYIAARQQKRDQQAAIDALSSHVGAIGQRREFTGTLYACYAVKAYPTDDCPLYHVNKLRMGDDIITYIGKPLGDAGAVLTLRATIKAHGEYKGVKSTQVNRPVIV